MPHAFEATPVKRAPPVAEKLTEYLQQQAVRSKRNRISNTLNSLVFMEFLKARPGRLYNSQNVGPRTHASHPPVLLSLRG